MPTFKGILTEQDITAVIAYIKSIEVKGERLCLIIKRLTEDNYLNHSAGVWSWMTTLTISASASCIFSPCDLLLVGGIFALMVRLNLFSPGSKLVDPDTYNKMFTYHGAIMVFLVIIPSIPAAIGNFILPMQIGAKDVAFPEAESLFLITSSDRERFSRPWLFS